MRPAWLFLLLPSFACSKQPSESPPPHTTETPPPRATPAPPASSAPPPAAAEAKEDAGIAAEKPAEKPVEKPPADEPPPKVKVISIGMHVAGGPYDEETKKPFLAAVEPRYPELARCWAKAADTSRPADVGVDLLIPSAGGKPKVDNPRSTVKGEDFLPCVVAFFESVEFGKPKSGGRQGVSYSVRFKPSK